MGGGQGHAHAAALQQHDHLVDATPCLQVLGVAGKGRARFANDAFVQRCCHHRVELAVAAAVYRDVERLQDRPGIARVKSARQDRRRQ